MNVLMTVPATPSFPFDQTVAERGDRGLAGAGFHADCTPTMELQAIQDGHSELTDDQAAWRHVVACTRQGSDLHRATFAVVDDVERTLIDATCGAWQRRLSLLPCRCTIGAVMAASTG